MRKYIWIMAVMGLSLVATPRSAHAQERLLALFSGLGERLAPAAQTAAPAADEGACFGEGCRRRLACFYGTSELFMLKRERSANRTFLGDETIPVLPPNAAVLFRELDALTTQNARFGFEPGSKTLIGYQFTDTLALEASFFMVETWDANASLRNADPTGATGISLNSPYLAIGGIPANLFQFNYQSRLQSGDFGIRAQTFRGDTWGVALTTGLRYIHVEDEMNLVATDPVTNAAAGVVAIERTTVHSQNHLLGWQLGGEATRSFNRVFIDVFGRAGIYANMASQNTTNEQTNFAVIGPTLGLLNTRENRIGWATHLDLGFRLGLQVTRRIEAYGGYQALFLSGLALAPEQLDGTHNDIRQSSIRPGVTGNDIHMGGAVFYHGPTLGLTVRW